MNAEEMWNEYKKINNNINDEYESWSFGDNSDLYIGIKSIKNFLQNV